MSEWASISTRGRREFQTNDFSGEEEERYGGRYKTIAREEQSN